MLYKISFLLILILALCAVSSLDVAATHAAPVDQDQIVNSTADTDDGSCDALGTGSGNKDCTLREAINVVNAKSGFMVKFNIPASADTFKTCSTSTGLCVIALASELPFVTQPIYIDGYTQAGASPNTLKVGDNANLKIVLDGSSAGNAKGLVITGGSSTVQGLNVRGFAFQAAIQVNSSGNTIRGNFIGTDSAGTSAAANLDGVVLSGNFNVVGGETADNRNLISGNSRYGLELVTHDSQILGNYIGTDATGQHALPNQTGIYIAHASNLVIGEPGALARNVISGNQYGIDVDRDVSGSTIQNNLLGITANAKSNLGNANYAILVGASKSATDVQGISLVHNAIFANGGLGIDLGGEGVTPNDNKDVDAGPNGLQNYPVLASATTGGTGTSIKGKLNSQPNQSFRIEFFASASCNAAAPSNYGEGRRYVGSVKVVTNGQGNVTFTFTKSKTYPVGSAMTATATQLVNDTPSSTSEFSKCLTAS